MISRAIALASAMSVPTFSPSHTSAHCGGRRPPRIDDVQPRAVLDPLEEMVEPDRMRLTGVRSPEEDEVGVLRFLV